MFSDRILNEYCTLHMVTGSLHVASEPSPQKIAEAEKQAPPQATEPGCAHCLVASNNLALTYTCIALQLYIFASRWLSFLLSLVTGSHL